MATTRLSSKNQITVPVEILREVGLGPGDVIDVGTDDSGHIILQRHTSRLDGVVGTVEHFEDYVDLRSQRSEWDER